MIEITGHVPPVQPGGVKHFRKVLGRGGGVGRVQKFLFWWGRGGSHEILK